jgi:hypothetical protein
LQREGGSASIKAALIMGAWQILSGMLSIGFGLMYIPT